MCAGGCVCVFVCVLKCWVKNAVWSHLYVWELLSIYIGKPFKWILQCNRQIRGYRVAFYVLWACVLLGSPSGINSTGCSSSNVTFLFFPLKETSSISTVTLEPRTLPNRRKNGLTRRNTKSSNRRQRRRQSSVGKPNCAFPFSLGGLVTYSLHHRCKLLGLKIPSWQHLYHKLIMQLHCFVEAPRSQRDMKEQEAGQSYGLAGNVIIKWNHQDSEAIMLINSFRIHRRLIASWAQGERVRPFW